MTEIQGAERVADRHQVPGGLPLIGPGRHLGPQDGACLMELVSLLAGEPFSDHPRCTHPALAELARLVNDACPRQTRPSLSRLAPELVGLHGPDPWLTAVLVHLCTRAARDVVPGRLDSRLAAAARHAARRRARAARGGPAGRWVTLTDPLYRLGAARHAMARAITSIGAAAPAETGAVLVKLLQEAVTASEQLLHPSAPPSRRSVRQAAGIP